VTNWFFDSLYRNGSRDNLLWLQQQGKFKFEYGDIRNQNDIIRILQSLSLTPSFIEQGRWP
jgi:hypothetical protein